MIKKYKYDYIDNTGRDTSMYHSVILAAIANNGQFDDDFADIFKLTKCPEGSAADYKLEFV